MNAGKPTAGWISPRSEPNRAHVTATPSTPANCCYVAAECSSLDVYAFKSHRNDRNPWSLTMIWIKWVHKYWYCYLHALATYVLESVLCCMKILDDFTYLQEEFSLGREASQVHVCACSCSISEFEERDIDIHFEIPSFSFTPSAGKCLVQWIRHLFLMLMPASPWRKPLWCYVSESVRLLFKLVKLCGCSPRETRVF